MFFEQPQQLVNGIILGSIYALRHGYHGLWDYQID